MLYGFGFRPNTSRTLRNRLISRPCPWDGSKRTRKPLFEKELSRDLRSFSFDDEASDSATFSSSSGFCEFCRIRTRSGSPFIFESFTVCVPFFCGSEFLVTPKPGEHRKIQNNAGIDARNIRHIFGAVRSWLRLRISIDGIGPEEHLA